MSHKPKEYDVVIMGAGPGGYVAAIRAAQLRLNVALIERDKLGGICLNWGCIPTKALLRSADIFNFIKKSEDFGILAENISFNYSSIIKRSRSVAMRLSRGIEYLMKV
ncbi:MAG: FAD-dependent oxidoreductase, partial [Fidelibacterota bacterium]